MAKDGRVLASLEPLFAAERERLLDSIEHGLHELTTATARGDRDRVFRALARDAHNLKGAAQFEARDELCARTAVFERQLNLLVTTYGQPSDVDLLFEALDALRRISRGTQFSERAIEPFAAPAG